LLTLRVDELHASLSLLLGMSPPQAAKKHARQWTWNELEWAVDIGAVKATASGDSVGSMFTSDQVRALLEL
jgi:hypothetical protein